MEMNENNSNYYWLIIVSALGMFCFFSCNIYTVQSHVKSGGLYSHKRSVIMTDYYRFYPDSILALVITSSNAKEASNWLTKDVVKEVGRYHIIDDSIFYFIMLPDGDTLSGMGRLITNRKIEITEENLKTKNKEEKTLNFFKAKLKN